MLTNSMQTELIRNLSHLFLKLGIVLFGLWLGNKLVYTVNLALIFRYYGHTNVFNY